MVHLNHTLHANVYNDKRISIKDYSEDLNLADSKWYSLFEYLIRETDVYYFFGMNLNFIDKYFTASLNNISPSKNNTIKESDNILLEIQSNQILFNREPIAHIWKYFNWPAILFLKEGLNEQLINAIFNGTRTFEQISDELDNIYILYQSFEADVLWIEKSRNTSSIF